MSLRSAFQLHEKLVKERKTAQHYQFKEMQIRISMTDHFIQTMIVVINFSEVENNKHWHDIEKLEHLCIADRIEKWSCHYVKQLSNFQKS